MAEITKAGVSDAGEGGRDRPSSPPDHTLRADPATVVWGQIPADAPPVLTVRPGQSVTVETVSHQGLMAEHPRTFFGARGIPAAQVLPEAVALFEGLARPAGAGAHLLTGPIAIEGAEPGDRLEVRIRHVACRVPYGVNATDRGWGVLPRLPEGRWDRLIPLDLDRGVARLPGGRELPIAPFPGILAVAPPGPAPEGTKPPGPWGGNLDLKRLTAGATLHLPVFQPGARFYAGDGHAAQGDGEIDGTAIETSLTCTFQFLLHKGEGMGMTAPWAEDGTHLYFLGLDRDLEGAMERAALAVVDHLCRHEGLAEVEAYALASLAVDFHVGEAVNHVKMVYGALPRRLLKGAPPYWG